MSLLRKIYRALAPNPLESILKSAQKENKNHFLIVWNRGLGDIALGLYSLVYRIRQVIPASTITFLTRPDLAEGFTLLSNVQVVVCPTWKRGVAFDLKSTLLALNLSSSSFDIIMENPDPTYWLAWQRGYLIPRLQWNDAWDAKWKGLGLSEHEVYVGAHVQTETNYHYEKNWPFASWQALFELAQKRGHKVILFGFEPKPVFEGSHIIDLRGRTTLSQMLSIIKYRCRYLVVPDSGVLSLTYYIDQSFPLDIISLWSDPNQGVLKQNVLSPNPLLKHVPLIGEKGDVSAIPVESVSSYLC